MGDKQYSSPPPYGFNQPAPPVTHQVVYTTPAMAMPVGPQSTHMTCPSCHASISTRLEKETTTKTHLFAFLLCIFMMWPCVVVPYCCDCCKNTNHYCPNCGTFLGTYNS